jgi:hypothetical protein
MVRFTGRLRSLDGESIASPIHGSYRLSRDKVDGAFWSNRDSVRSEASGWASDARPVTLEIPGVGDVSGWAGQLDGERSSFRFAGRKETGEARPQ